MWPPSPVALMRGKRSGDPLLLEPPKASAGRLCCDGLAAAAASFTEDLGVPVNVEVVDPDLTDKFQQAAATANEARLSTRLDAESAYSYEPPAGEDEEPSEAADEAPEPRTPWAQLDQLARIQWASDYVSAMMTPGPEGAVVGWKPYDGSVVSLEDGIAVVDLRVQPRDLAPHQRHGQLGDLGAADASEQLFRFARKHGAANDFQASFPCRKALRPRISANMHPADQMSMASVYCLRYSNSGARYHRVTT